MGPIANFEHIYRCWCCTKLVFYSERLKPFCFCSFTPKLVLGYIQMRTKSNQSDAIHSNSLGLGSGL